MIGRTLYELLVKGYTEKQWGKKATEQSPELINRLPVRDTFDNRYFNDRYQGIPEEGYSRMIEKIHITNFVHLLIKQIKQIHTTMKKNYESQEKGTAKSRKRAKDLAD